MADSLKSLIDSLPDTAEGIAAYLEGQGIKGIKRHGSACPLAQLLRAHGFDSPMVAGTIFNLREDHVEIVKHTPATGLFLVWFDGGLFPQLDAMAPRKME